MLLSRFNVSKLLILFQVRKEYRKFIRRHSWLPKCLRCSKSSSGAGGSSSANTGSCTASGGVGKERRPSLYGSNGNPSGGTNSHSTDNSVLTPHGTSVGTNSNNSIVISNNLNNSRPTALVQILSRTDLNNASTTMTNHNRQHNVSQQGTNDVRNCVYTLGQLILQCLHTTTQLRFVFNSLTTNCNESWSSVYAT